MSFVALGGDGSTRPTFFELVAAERLMPSLKAATVYSLSVRGSFAVLQSYAVLEDLLAEAVFAQRRPIFHRLLDFEDELFAIITAALDRQSLLNGSSSFAESLYGLRRNSVRGADNPKASLNKPSQRWTLLFLVVLPYMQAKLESVYNRRRRQTRSPLALRITQRSSEVEPDADQQPERRSLWRRTQAQILRLFVRLFPWIHATQEGLRFGYQLLYLLDSSPFYTPILHLLGQNIVRVSGQEMVEVQRQKQQRRQQQLQSAQRSSSVIWRLVSQGWLRSAYAFADHTRNALILSVFAFKLLEWWYTSAEEKLGAQQALPPPPPPPPPKPSPDGLKLPGDPTTCPICRKRRTNPAMASVSGYVYCYPCIFGSIDQHGCCPVTKLPATVDQIRRLYQSA
ncbi:MAG: Peroxisome biogenesis 12 [Trebouxia sp. A1-2]|nr:MAG: Peroxisome biogenesis 12 [Trebouxia sp. A1-2]